MRQGVPCISQPALWWAPERIYGAPDLLVLSSWLRERFPGLLGESSGARPLRRPGPEVHDQDRRERQGEGSAQL